MTLINFTKFSPNRYNDLPKAADSSKNLQQHSDFTEFLEKFYSLVKEYSVELEFGLRLIHRHMQVDEGKVMVEKFQFHQDVPALITSADFPTEETYPASWLLENNNELSVFEFSNDVQVKHVLEKLAENPSIFMKVCELIREYNLENLLAPSIIARDSRKHFEMDYGFVEITDFESNASIVKNKKNQPSNNNSVDTLWTYNAYERKCCSDHGDNKCSYNDNH
jgi:hypothetical protein